jgi:DNA polymerase I-like protein with 3'-5' exonuclease and polymerase domains
MTQSKPEDIITLKQMLEDRTAKVFFDAKKALNFFYAAGFEVNGPIYDVMLMDKILQAGVKNKNVTIHRLITQYLGAIIVIDSAESPIVKEAEMLPKLYEAMWTAPPKLDKIC